MSAYDEYLAAHAENPFINIHDYLDAYGYFDLNEFQKDKTKYLLARSNIEIEITTPKESAVKTLDYVRRGREAVVLSIDNPTNFAWHQNEDIDYDKFAAAGFEIYETQTPGGTILGSPDDLGIAIFLSNQYEILDFSFFNDLIVEYLRKSLVNHTIVKDSNDILINNKKIIGASAQAFEDKILYVAHVSFHDFSEEAAILCPKQSDKQPGCIPPGVARAALIEEIKQWFKI